MPSSMQPDLQHEQVLLLAPSAASVLGLGNQSTRMALLRSHCPPPALRRRKSEQGLELLVEEAGRQEWLGAGRSEQRSRAQAEERRSGIKESHPPAVGTSVLFLHPSKPQVPGKQLSISPANGASHLPTREARSESSRVQLARSLTRSWVQSC